MKTCALVQLQLAEFLDGDLGGAEAQAVTSHLATCPECTAELDREQRLRTVLGGMQPRRCPPGVTAKLLTTARDRTRSSPPGRSIAHLFPLGVTVALAASLVTMVLLKTPELPPPDFHRGTEISGQTQFTPEEVTAARRDLVWTLALTARVIDHAEKKTVSEVFGRKLPAAITGSLRRATSASQGGKG